MVDVVMVTIAWHMPSNAEITSFSTQSWFPITYAADLSKYMLVEIDASQLPTRYHWPLQGSIVGPDHSI